MTNHRALMLALASGALIGAGAAILLHRLNQNLAAKIAQLSAKVDLLNREVEELKLTQGASEAGEEVVDGGEMLQLGSGMRRQGSSAFFSIHGSSGEEDEDDFEDTLEGTEELPGHRSEDGLMRLQSDDYVSADEGITEYKSGITEYRSDIGCTSVLQKADKLLEGTDKLKEEAYKMLCKSKCDFQKNPEYLWRLAKATYLQSQTEGAKGDEATKKSLIYSASKAAKEALTLRQDSPNIHKWCAITLGSVGDYETTQVKITNGYKFKEHIETAIKLNPEDPSAHYLLGRWCFGVYMLTWMERKVAATLFATPPSSTVEEALKHFLQAEKLQPGKWKENLLYIGKCYIEQRDYTTALQWLQKAKHLPVLDNDDREAETEVDTLLAKYSYYSS